MRLKAIVFFALFATGIGGIHAAELSVEITHPPYLTHPGTDRMSIGWGTKEKCAAEVYVREIGTDSYIPYTQEYGGQVPHYNTTHLIPVDGLKPGTRYEYKIANMIPTKPERRYGETYTQIVQDTVYTFTTFDARKPAFNAFVCTDIHSNPKHLLNFMEMSGVDTADMMIGLGDMSQYIFDAEIDIFKGYLHDAAVRLKGVTPMVILRGNHDWRGAQSLRWIDIWGTPERNGYYAFTHGPAHFIVLDAGEDKRDQLPGAFYTYYNRSEKYMPRQRAWLEKAVQTDAFKNAKYRIVLIHIATHGQGNSYPSVRMKELFADVLNKSEADQRVHLMLSGHIHRDLRYNAGATVPAKGAVGRRPIPEEMTGRDFHYPVVSISNKSFMNLTIDSENIRCRTYDENGAPVDAFDISPNGKLTEKMKGN